MKAHRTDSISLTFGLIFILIAGGYLASRYLEFDVPSVGWFIAGGLILLGAIGAITALVPSRKAEPLAEPETEPQAELQAEPTWQSQPEPETEPAWQSQAERETASQAEPTWQSQAERETASQAESQAEPQAESQAEPQAEPAWRPGPIDDGRDEGEGKEGADAERAR